MLKPAMPASYRPACKPGMIESKEMFFHSTFRPITSPIALPSSMSYPVKVLLSGWKYSSGG